MSPTLTYYLQNGIRKRRGQSRDGWLTLLNESFNDWTSGNDTTPPSTGYWNSRMGMGTGVGGGGSVNLQNVRLKDLGGGQKCLRFVLPANGVPSNKGTTMWCQMPQTVSEAVLEYDVRFASPFSPFGWGGKLPGLGGVDMVAGVSPSRPSGGNGPSITDGWSGRLMWIGRATNGTSSYNTLLGTRSNRGLLYTYGYDGAGQYGDNDWFTPAGDSFVPGTWHHLRIHYRLNSLGQANGFLAVQIDGAVVYTESTWMPRNVNANVRISHLWMHIFRGGDTSDWSTPTEEYVDIDNLRITVPPGAP